MLNYSAETPDGKKENGDFNGNGDFKFQKKLKWAGFYSPSLKTGTVSWLIENTCPNETIARLWDKPPAYRKFYLQSYTNQLLKKDTPVCFHLRTSFFEAGPDNWQAEAEKTAYSLEKSKTDTKL